MLIGPDDSIDEIQRLLAHHAEQMAYELHDLAQRAGSLIADMEVRVTQYDRS